LTQATLGWAQSEVGLWLLWPTCGCCQLLVVSHQHQAILPGQTNQPTKEPLVGGVGGVDSHLLQLNLACLRGSTLFAASRLRSTGPYPYP